MCSAYGPVDLFLPTPKTATTDINTATMATTTTARKHEFSHSKFLPSLLPATSSLSFNLLFWVPYTLNPRP